MSATPRTSRPWPASFVLALLGALILSPPAARPASAGADAIVNDFMARIGPLSGNTLKVEVLDIAVSSDHAVAIQHVKLENEGIERDASVTEPSEPSFTAPPA